MKVIFHRSPAVNSRPRGAFTQSSPLGWSWEINPLARFTVTCFAHSKVLLGVLLRLGEE